MIRWLHLRSSPIEPGANVVLTCPLRTAERALHLDIDVATSLAFEIRRTEKSSQGVHIDLHCRATEPSVFHGALLVSRDEGLPFASKAAGHSR